VVAGRLAQTPAAFAIRYVPAWKDETLFSMDISRGAPLGRKALGAAERERFPAVKQVVAQTVRDPDAAARAGSARLETG
jgi:hypothetical protein